MILKLVRDLRVSCIPYTDKTTLESPPNFKRSGAICVPPPMSLPSNLKHRINDKIANDATSAWPPTPLTKFSRIPHLILHAVREEITRTATHGHRLPIPDGRRRSPDILHLIDIDSQ
eukprot:scaffold7419_cov31-Tisochrysis_lutea.AAC.4